MASVRGANEGFCWNMTNVSCSAVERKLNIDEQLPFVTGFSDWFFDPTLPPPTDPPRHWRGDQTLFVEPPCGRWSDAS